MRLGSLESWKGLDGAGRVAPAATLALAESLSTVVQIGIARRTPLHLEDAIFANSSSFGKNYHYRVILYMADGPKISTKGDRYVVIRV